MTGRAPARGASPGDGPLPSRLADRLSLRSRFALLAAAAAALVVVGVAGASWFLVRVRLNQQFDDQLRASAELAARSTSAQDALGVLRSDTPQRRGPGGPGGRRSDLVVQFV
ncbi:hypothetical protein [Actinosynnema sp.]|uniref:hypothetical protein n=1 Tax=Actinosynnema sp. TaxID=1872144 RepID=UPI003F837943